MLDARFWTKVDKTDPGGCWRWTAGTNGLGYGLFRPGGCAPKRLAHRLAYAEAHGEIAPGLRVLHRCDNPSCVNPEHLRLGTQADNMADMTAKGRGRPGVRYKLVAEQVRVIRTRIGLGEPIGRIARDLSVDHKTIRAIRDGVSWTHLV